jgi:hypothetical protein
MKYSILIYPSSAPHSTAKHAGIRPSTASYSSAPNQSIRPNQHGPPFRRCSAPLPTDESELLYVSPAPALASTHRLLLLLSVPRGHWPAHRIDEQSRSVGSSAPTSWSVSFLLWQAHIGPAPSSRSRWPVHLIDKESPKSTLQQCWQLPKLIVAPAATPCQPQLFSFPSRRDQALHYPTSPLQY